MSQLSLNDLSVVLVEPSSAQHKIIAGYMARLKVGDVRWVRNGGQALTELRTAPADLVVSAMHFDDMTGVDLVYAMREDELLRSTPFLLISSETHYRYLEPIRQAGTIGILPKPFSIEQLQRALYATIDYFEPGKLDVWSIEPDRLEVLLVDDSALSRRHIRGLLRNLGIENISEAEDGLQALELIGKQFFDLIITDYHMPQMDGRELVEHIRASNSQASVPIMMISGESDARRLAAVQQAGVSAICDKPFEPSGIKQLIESLLG